jgi:hypothetical protein
MAKKTNKGGPAIRQTNQILDQSSRFGDQMMNRFAPATNFLGRISSGITPAMQQFTGELEAMRQGFTPGEQAQLDEQRRMGFQRQLQGQQSAMARRAANSGVRGTAALAAQADLGQQFAGQEAQAQTDLAAQNVAARERRMGMYGQQLGANQSFQREGDIFNLDQQAAEQAARQSAFFGGMGMFGSTLGGQQGLRMAEENQRQQKAFLDQQAARLR